MKEVNLEEILNAKNLHSYYYPGGDFKQKMIHDFDCKFCLYEEEVLEAMHEACRQVLELGAENARVKYYYTDDGNEVDYAEVKSDSITNTINQVKK